MNRLISLLILTVLSVSAVASEEAEVRKMVNLYLDARANGDPNLAGSLISRKSLEEIERMRQKALHADRESLCKMTLSAVTRILVIRARHYRDLPKLNAEALAGYGVAKQSFIGDVPRDIKVNIVTNNKAVAQVANPLNRREHQQIDLIRERGKWWIVLSFGADSASMYEPFWQQQKRIKGATLHWIWRWIWSTRGGIRSFWIRSNDPTRTRPTAGSCTTCNSLYLTGQTVSGKLETRESDV